MAELISHQEPRAFGMEGGWTIWEYRGATARSQGVCNRLLIPGYQLHDKTLGHYGSWFPIIDRWLDHDGLPTPMSGCCRRSASLARPSPAPISPPASGARLLPGRSSLLP